MSSVSSVNPAPPLSVTAVVVNDLRNGDNAKVDAAVEQIRGFIKDGHIADALWKNWIPQLMRINRYDDVVEFSLNGGIARPGTLGRMMAFRAEALLAINQRGRSRIWRRQQRDWRDHFELRTARLHAPTRGCYHCNSRARRRENRLKLSLPTKSTQHSRSLAIFLTAFRD